LIVVNDIHKSFGNIRAVRGVSFDAPDGKITGLLGPNGAGKSTTLRILYTVLKPDQGSATIDGANVVGDSLDARRRIGALPHGAGLYPHLTARENIAYYAKLCGIESSLIEARVDNIIGLLEIGDFADRRSKGFSQGQRTKVALARGLVHDPQNIILDEPSNGLDVMATRSLRNLILKLKDAGRCILFSSHVMQEVAALCDDICIIAKSRHRRLRRWHSYAHRLRRPRRRVRESDPDGDAGMMRTLITVFKKEALDNVRDRRTLASALIMGPLFGPILFAFVINLSIERSLDNVERVTTLPVIGREHAPNLLRFLESRNIDIIDGPTSRDAAIEAVRTGAHDVIVLIPAEFGAQLADSIPARVELITDQANAQAERGFLPGSS